MKSLKILLLLLLWNTFTYGQNYQTVNSKRVAYYENQSKNISCIRIDSAKFQTDSILYPFTTLQQMSNDCISASTASWIGQKIVVDGNGNNYFYNKNNEPITIKTSAKIGDSWIAFQITDSLIIEASVINHDILTFLGIEDSVKTIEFKAYDKNMNLLDFEVNQMQVMISKNHGFVKTLNFNLFPHFHFYYPIKFLEEKTLVGLSAPQVGVQNLTWLEVYDFQVGDELHILDESSCWNGSGGGSAITNKAIYKYLERTEHPDSIVYRYSRKQSIHTRTTSNETFSFYNDTLEEVVKPNHQFDKLPEAPIISGNMAINYHMVNESPISKNYPNYQLYSTSDGLCWRLMMVDGCLKVDKYIKGLGGPYYSCENGFCLGGSKRELVYYKKGETTWGNQLTVTGVSDLKEIPNIKIYPNPAITKVNFRIEDAKQTSVQIYIYDIQGRLKKSGIVDIANSGIDISDLPTGLYIIKIADSDRIIKLEKLIINR